MFTPQVHQALEIDGRAWLVAPHPSATDMPHGQEGRAAVVYALIAADHVYTEPVRVHGASSFTVPVDGTPVRVGRGPRNEVVLDEPAVSREHGAFVVQRGRLFFWDNSSRNGTLLDGERLEPQKWVPVPPGGRLQLGALEHGVALSVRPDPDACRALKVFKSRFRVPRLVELSTRLAPFASMAGLRVCERRVLTPQDHGDLLAAEDSLVYAALMPWIDGRTWMELILERALLSPAASLSLARGFLDVLARMEQRGMAHCDLSGPNVTVGEDLRVELVDVEQLHGPGLLPPDDMFAGSPGYAHPHLGEDAWSACSDRFSGAVLAAEMLGWCDPAVAEAASSESFFEPDEMGVDNQRFRLLCGFLETRWGAPAARLFERAWFSESPSHCPSFGEWLVALPGEMPGSADSSESSCSGGTPAGAAPPPADADPAGDAGSSGPAAPRPEPLTADPGPAPFASAPRGMEQGRVLEEAGDLPAALEAYREALAESAPDSAHARELALIVQQLEAQVPAPAPVVELPPRPALDPELLARIRELEGPPGLPETAPAPPKGPLLMGAAAFLAVLLGLATLGMLILGGLFLWTKYWH